MKCSYCETEAKKSCGKYACSRCVNIIVTGETLKDYPDSRERLLSFKPTMEDTVLLIEAKINYSVYAE